MTRDVNLVSYLPPFMADFMELRETHEAENPEFKLVWNGADRVLGNEFIATADEYGISRFEKILKIYPSSEDTLESRRSRVQSRWFNTLPYTMRSLVQKLIVLCGSRGNFALSDNFTVGYTLALATDLELFGQVEELERIIGTMIPCNIHMDVANIFQCQVSGGMFSAGGVCNADVFMITPDFREEATASGSTNFANALGNVAYVMVTPDFNESNTIRGAMNFANAFSQVAGAVATEDFQEQVAVQGQQNVAAGVAVAEILSTESEV